MRLSCAVATCWIASLLPEAKGWTTNQAAHRPRTALCLSQKGHNVVLEPSTDDVAFDSFKIGGARVHRYSRDTDPDSEIEYVMWYHGRSTEMSKDAALPPLSTGRIGRATSKNGLIWEKDTVGSASEDTTGVSLGLNIESWWSFDTAHVGLGAVLLPMSTPAVMMDGGVHLMFFHGGNMEETSIADYMDKEVPEALKDAKLQGMRMKIGVAVSQDGVCWGRVEGDDPSGACIAPWDLEDETSPDLPKGQEEEMYCAWPEVVANLDDGAEFPFIMYYSSMTKDNKEKCIAYATSPDGFRWDKRGVCLRPDTEGLDSAGCARCCVVRDAEFDDDAGTWKELKSWTMYYEGVSPGDSKHRIMVAKSKNGETWTKGGTALDVGAEEAWDVSGVGSPHLVR
jgi:hypothetical protein